MSMKICSSCKNEKELIQFSKNATSVDGLQDKCKDCVKSYIKEHYIKNSQYYKDKAKERKKRQRIQWDEFKASLKCSKCPENHPACLDFHHLDPSVKEFSISNSWHRYGSDRWKKELDKCVVLCSNCHRKEHALVLATPSKR